MAGTADGFAQRLCNERQTASEQGRSGNQGMDVPVEHKKYHGMLIWLPALIGFMLPIAASLGVRIFIDDGNGSPRLHDDVREIAPIVMGAALNAVPFGVASLLTKQDIRSGLDLRRIMVRWLVRFLPVLGWNVLLLVNIIVASVKDLPGASTAAIALLTVPLVGTPAVLISHWIIDKLQEK